MKVKVSKNGSKLEEKYLVAHLEEAHGTLMCRGTPVEKHCSRLLSCLRLWVRTPSIKENVN